MTMKKSPPAVRKTLFDAPPKASALVARSSFEWLPRYQEYLRQCYAKREVALNVNQWCKKQGI